MPTPTRAYRVPAPLTPNSFSSTNNMVSREDLDPYRSVKTEDYTFFQSKRFKVCFLAMCLNVVLFALDQFIITVAVPQIVSEFNALDQVEWLNTAFFIPCAGGILVYTQIMTVASPRWVYLAAVTIFEIGSAICGAAQSMNMLIVGRAIAGLGGAGMWNATYLIGGEVIPFEKRPGFFGLFGASYILASVMGPLVGGALTDTGNTGWRWCFYINLPIGGVTLCLLLATLPTVRKLPPFDGLPDNRSIVRKILRLDWLSAILTLGFVTCLGIGLQWGGISKEWSDAGVIVTLVLAFALFVVLMAWSLLLGPRAMIPMSLLKRRHFSAGIWVSFFGYGTIVVYLYYLPLYFEAIKDKSATRAGVLLLGLQLTMCPLLIIAGKLGERTGQAKITILVGSCLMAVASGLLTLINKSSSIGMLVGFEIIAGIGFGCVLNIMVVLTQADYLKTPHLVPHVTNVLNFWGFVGRIIGMSTATNIFENKLKQGLGAIAALDAAVTEQITASPKAIWTAVPSEFRDQVLDVYSHSLDKVWWLALAFSIACLVAGALMRNLNLKQLGEEAIKARQDASPPGYALQASAAVGDDKTGSTQSFQPQPRLEGWKH